jgi:predicted MarR family transcription regulator
MLLKLASRGLVGPMVLYQPMGNWIILCLTKNVNILTPVRILLIFSLFSAEFDQIIRLCFQTMAKCIYLLLGPVEKIKKGKLITKGKRSKEHFKFWHRYGPLAKRYLEAVHIVRL